jgi:hypothetical protein
MNVRTIPAVALLSLAACAASSSSDRWTAPPEKVFEEQDRSPARSAGWCNRCNFSVFEGHRCGLTAPCALCQREAGARHLHEVVWICERDDLAMAQQHECVNSKTCGTCTDTHRRLLGARGCERCHRLVPAAKLHGITSYCGTCNLEVGANHLCGKTKYCRSCLREAGGGHKCDVTRLCPSHEIEHAPDHVHGTTEYCARCHRDAGSGHRHGLTEWCWRCEAEMEWPHCHH